MDEFLQEQLLLHREQAHELGRNLDALKEEKEELEEKLKQNNDNLTKENQNIREKIKGLEAEIEPLQKELEEVGQEIKEFERTEELTEHADLEASVGTIQTTSANLTEKVSNISRESTEVTNFEKNLDFTDEVKKIGQMQKIGSDKRLRDPHPN
ncbi:hypothetical protein GAMM_60055 [Gammaproteobacteria bacterium]